MRLPARISEIKDSGVKVIKTMERGQNRFGEPTRYARYRLGGTAAINALRGVYAVMYGANACTG
jgi:hypothetical protein